VNILRRKRIKIYLAHPLGSRHEIRKWEKQLERKYKINLHNPFYDNKREDINYLDRGMIEPYSVERIRKSKEIVKADLDAIFKSDALIAILPYPSIGVSMEIFYAATVCDIPVFILTSIRGHPWLNAMGKIYRTRKGIENAIKRLKKGLK